jgi:Zn-dependent metalloprotease
MVVSEGRSVMKKRAARCGLRAGLLIAVLGGLTPGRAFRGADDAASYAIPLQEFDLFSYSTPETQQAGLAVTDALSQRYGGSWRIYAWNPQTRTPGNLYGSGAPVTAALRDAETVEAVARQVLATNAATLGVNPAELRLTGTPHGLGKWAAHFQQTYQGLDVWGGRVHLTFTESGRLFAMGSEFYGGITLDATPRYNARQAEGVAQADLPFNAATDRIEEGTTLMVLPVPLTETAVEHHLAWRVAVRTAEPLGVWATWVDAHDGRILWRTNDIAFVDFIGTDRGEVEPNTYCNGPANQPLKYARVSVAGVGSTYAGADGSWIVPCAGSDARDVTATLYSPYTDVNNQGGPDAQFTGTATPGTPFPIWFDDEHAQRDERDAFNAISDLHDFFMLFDPAFAYIHQSIVCNVSLPQTCNAYWDGYSINFFAEGDGCANTGQIQGVVHHEYGHGVQNAILGWQGNEGLGEGNGDVLANLMTRESMIGRGFYWGGCGEGIRNSENTLVYPENVEGQEEHDAGRVIAGFHWDVMQGLWGLYGPDEGTRLSAALWHFARVLEQPVTQPAQVLATFIADDDNGNLEDGTPHFPYLCAAAERHHFACPTLMVGVIIQHTPLLTTTEEGDRDVTATIFSTEAPLDPDSILVRYRIDGGSFQQLVMSPAGPFDEYGATLPGLQEPCTVEYYLRAVDEAGNASNHPADAPDELHTFDVVHFYDPMETEDGWTVNLEGTDDAVDGFWERVDPVGTTAQPENDHTPDPAAICWVTENGAPGDLPGAHDVDSGTTSLYTAVYDLSGADSVQVSYWRWYSYEMGMEDDDWWNVDVRNDGGDWVTIEHSRTYTHRWHLVAVDAKTLFGDALGQVQFRFRASDTQGLSMVEAAIDDLKIRVWDLAAEAPEPIADPPRFALHGSRSNPVVGATEIAFQVPVATGVRLTLFDVTGRALRTLADGRFDPGVHHVAWDGCDAGGIPLGAGVYYCRMQSGGFTAVRSVVLSR